MQFITFYNPDMLLHCGCCLQAAQLFDSKTRSTTGHGGWQNWKRLHRFHGAGVY